MVDPELMVSVPPRYTADQGFDALFHSTECYISKAHNWMGDMLALTAIKNIGKYLVRAVKDGADPCDLSHEECVAIYRKSY